MRPSDTKERLEKHCFGCSEWNALYRVCLRGHLSQSPTGCPLRKFTPLYSTAYDEDRGRVILLPDPGRCAGCGD